MQVSNLERFSLEYSLYIHVDIKPGEVQFRLILYIYVGIKPGEVQFKLILYIYVGIKPGEVQFRIILVYIYIYVGIKAREWKGWKSEGFSCSKQSLNEPDTRGTQWTDSGQEKTKT